VEGASERKLTANVFKAKLELTRVCTLLVKLSARLAGVTAMHKTNNNNNNRRSKIYI